MLQTEGFSQWREPFEMIQSTMGEMMEDTRLFISAVQKYGTPLFLYDEGIIRQRMRSLKETFASLPAQIFYAMKANSRKKILGIVLEEGIGIEAASAGEIYRAVSAGFPPERIIFNGNGKTPFEVEYAIKKGVEWLNFDAIDQWELIHEAGKKLGRKVKTLMRLNPGIAAGGHSSWATGVSYSKFGLQAEEVKEAVQQSTRFTWAPISGLHSHFGTQVLEVEPFLKNAQYLIEMRRNLKDEGISADVLDLGGGIGVVYRPEEKPFRLEEYVSGLQDILQGEQVQIFLEPGRFLVAEAGVLLTRVVSIKKGSKNFLVVDAGMTENPRPMLYDAYHPIRLLSLDSLNSRSIEEEQAIWDVVGPVCESDDFLGRGRKLSEPRVGDIVVVGVCGAYCSSMGSNYNSRVFPAEVLVQGENFLLIRPRQTFRDIGKY